MKYYEAYQRLDYGYKKTKENLEIYLRASIGIYLPAGVTLGGYPRERDNKWEIHLFPELSNSVREEYLWEKTEYLLLNKTDHPPVTSAATNESSVRQVISSMLGKTKVFTVTTIVYNEKNVPVGQVTNTIAGDGQIVII